MDEKYELVKFEQGDLIIDVNVSPSEDTVWLTKDDMSLLYGRDRTVISRHIRNIYVEGELDEKSTRAKNAHMVSKRNRLYESDYYNLDVVISVGYRVKSRNGIIFRRWANSVLKEYLLRGYAINSDRTLITDDNYIELVHRVNKIDKRLFKLESNNHIDNEKLFFDGQWFDARSFIKDIIESADEEIILIDPYSDIKTLDYLKIKSDGVKIQLFTSSKAKLSRGDISAFNKQYGKLEVKIINNFHDRFLILDNKTLYHLGTSLNYLGKKSFAITKIEDLDILFSIKKKIES